MKHGPIALTDTNTTVVGIIPKDFVYDKMLSNIEEVKARHATIFVIASEGDTEIHKYSNYAFYVPSSMKSLRYPDNNTSSAFFILYCQKPWT